ncbi:class I SAM-dependent methyltransferase [Rhodoligotrophos ferricapiens]|uniref:class I SAM-dependent methyltransferase n=1 Tax=Rhodoligotrophos ferricapiens TaxID=3069264 RepID=UPI00315D3814
MSPIHPDAEQGFSRSPDTYMRGRPDYPPEISSWLTEVIGLGPDKIAVDLGAGTGKFTRYLLGTGASVIAVEPVDAMRAKLMAVLPDVDARVGTAEAMSLPAASVDAVLCAQAFHWFATAEVLTEIHRVLKPGGMLGLVWNLQDRRVSWVSALAAIVAPYRGETPQVYTGEWRCIFPADGFGPLEELVIPHSHRGPAQQVIIDRVLSTSSIAALPAQEQAAIVAQLNQLIASTPALAGKREVVFPYETRAFACRKL